MNVLYMTNCSIHIMLVDDIQSSKKAKINPNENKLQSELGNIKQGY